MTKKEINDYYEGLEHNCINNFGGYTKEQVEDNTNHLNDSDDDFDNEYNKIWGDIIESEFDYNDPY